MKKMITQLPVFYYSIVSFLLLINPSYGKDLPNAKFTPGRTVDVSMDAMCTYGYSRSVRHVSIDTKKLIYAEYGVSYQPGVAEVDHLIPLCLGGSNDRSNLWPQLYDGEWNAHKKDELEVKLCKMVCHYKLDRAVAQKAIATNWIDAYEEYVINNGEKK